MHESVLHWVERVAAERELWNVPVLDVGSRDVNGSPRTLWADHAFEGPFSYVGVDARPGPGVDVVAWSHELPFARHLFGAVLCLETLEHDPAPWRTLPELARVLRPEGYLLLTTRGPLFPLHEHPADYWRFTADGLRRLLELAPELELRELVDDPAEPGSFCLAVKAR